MAQEQESKYRILKVKPKPVEESDEGAKVMAGGVRAAGSTIAPTVLRLISAVPKAGPIGAVAGGLGEYAAQKLETPDKPINVGRVLGEAALGAIPFGGTLSRGMSAAKGALAAAGGAAMRKATSEDPKERADALNPVNWTGGDWIGTLLGAGIGGALGKSGGKGPAVVKYGASTEHLNPRPLYEDLIFTKNWTPEQIAREANKLEAKGDKTAASGLRLAAVRTDRYNNSIANRVIRDNQRAEKEAADAATEATRKAEVARRHASMGETTEDLTISDTVSAKTRTGGKRTASIKIKPKPEEEAEDMIDEVLPKGPINGKRTASIKINLPKGPINGNGAKGPINGERPSPAPTATSRAPKTAEPKELQLASARTRIRQLESAIPGTLTAKEHQELQDARDLVAKNTPISAATPVTPTAPSKIVKIPKQGPKEEPPAAAAVVPVRVPPKGPKGGAAAKAAPIEEKKSKFGPRGNKPAVAAPVAGAPIAASIPAAGGKAGVDIPASSALAPFVEGAAIKAAEPTPIFSTSILQGRKFKTVEDMEKAVVLHNKVSGLAGRENANKLNKLWAQAETLGREHPDFEKKMKELQALRKELGLPTSKQLMAEAEVPPVPAKPTPPVIPKAARVPKQEKPVSVPSDVPAVRAPAPSTQVPGVSLGLSPGGAGKAAAAPPKAPAKGSKAKAEPTPAPVPATSIAPSADPMAPRLNKGAKKTAEPTPKAEAPEEPAYTIGGADEPTLVPKVLTANEMRTLEDDLERTEFWLKNVDKMPESTRAAETSRLTAQAKKFKAQIAEAKQAIKQSKKGGGGTTLGSGFAGMQGLFENNPDLAMKLAGAGGGAALGASMNEEDPMKGAAVGGLAGLSVGHTIPNIARAIQAKPLSGGAASRLSLPERLANFYRASLLSNPNSLAINTVAAPWGAGVIGSTERALTGLAQGRPDVTAEGVGGLKQLVNPEHAKRFGPAFAEGKYALGDLERGERLTGPTWLDDLASLPSRLLYMGDRATRNALQEGGMSDDLARAVTLTANPKTDIGNLITNSTKRSPAATFLLPFSRTAVNIFESALERAPGIGEVWNIIRNPLHKQDIATRAVQQGMGAGMTALGYYVGNQVDPNDKVSSGVIGTLISNMGGQYAALVAAGYAAGLANQQGKFDTGLPGVVQRGATMLKSGVSELPLPTTQGITDLVTSGQNYAETGLAHPQAQHAPSRYLPQMLVPGFMKDNYLDQTQAMFGETNPYAILRKR